LLLFLLLVQVMNVLLTMTQWLLMIHILAKVYRHTLILKIHFAFALCIRFLAYSQTANDHFMASFCT